MIPGLELRRARRAGRSAAARPASTTSCSPTPPPSSAAARRATCSPRAPRRGRRQPRLRDPDRRPQRAARAPAARAAPDGAARHSRSREAENEPSVSRGPVGAARRGADRRTRWSSWRSCSARFDGTPPRAARPARGAPARARRRRHARLPRRDAEVREGDWKVAPPPPDLQNRRVEITGPTERKMVINALNSGATRLHGGLRGLELADVGATWSAARST